MSSAEVRVRVGVRGRGRVRVRVRVHQVEGDGELGGGVRGELDQVAAAQALVLLPGVHDGAVVDGDDVHLVDPRLLKLALDLGFLEARDLARGSGGREGAQVSQP